MDYPVVIVPLSEDDGGGWLGFAPDLPGCMSDGETRTEAITNTEDAILEWLDDCAEMGEEAPAPGSSVEKGMAELKKLLNKVDKLSGENKELAKEVKGLKAWIAANVSFLNASRELAAKLRHSPQPLHA